MAFSSISSHATHTSTNFFHLLFDSYLPKKPIAAPFRHADCISPELYLLISCITIAKNLMEITHNHLNKSKKT